ncbi:hypothetical protein SSP531S_09640 [Streptomyces spongiicola]|uniref:Uncharacterized protein n=1 Tax=Streptomyces spongiicola TaxID=1690221 RepID=A0A388SV00_9ACTN|nr:hypothetical protein SSP531S_09640 [Streptomyces spongiicola]
MGTASGAATGTGATLRRGSEVMQSAQICAGKRLPRTVPSPPVPVMGSSGSPGRERNIVTAVDGFPAYPANHAARWVSLRPGAAPAKGRGPPRRAPPRY